MDQDHPMLILMKEYLRSGSLGGVRPGDSTDNLLSLFGEPDDKGGFTGKRRIPRIWKYGDVEFHSAEDGRTISLIFCDNFEQLSLGSAGSLDPWIFKGQRALSEVEAELEAAGIPFERGTTEGPMQLLRLESGVELLVAMAPDEFGWPGFTGLYGFQQVLSNG